MNEDSYERFNKLNVKGKAYHIISGLEGSWLVNALWDQLKDEGVCEKIFDEFTDNLGDEFIERIMEDISDEDIPFIDFRDDYRIQAEEMAKTDGGMRALLDQYESDSRWEVSKSIYKLYKELGGLI